jgi:hypothetical protein
VARIDAGEAAAAPAAAVADVGAVLTEVCGAGRGVLHAASAATQQAVTTALAEPLEVRTGRDEAGRGMPAA